MSNKTVEEKLHIPKPVKGYATVRSPIPNATIGCSQPLSCVRVLKTYSGELRGASTTSVMMLTMKNTTCKTEPIASNGLSSFLK